METLFDWKNKQVESDEKKKSDSSISSDFEELAEQECAI